MMQIFNLFILSLCLLKQFIMLNFHSFQIIFQKFIVSSKIIVICFHSCIRMFIFFAFSQKFDVLIFLQ